MSDTCPRCIGAPPIEKRPKMVACHNLFPGIRFTKPIDKTEWEITGKIDDGEEIPGIGKIRNPLKNKWWAIQIGTNDPQRVICVDHVLDVELWKLRVK